MKTLRVPFFILLAAAFAEKVQAVPIWFSFQGVITSSTFGDFPVGDPVEYVLMVDRELNGRYVHHEQAFPLMEDGFFYVENAGSMHIGVGRAFSDKSFFGFEILDGADTHVQITGSDPFYYDHPESGDRVASIRISTDKAMDTWAIGQDGFLGAVFPTREIESELRLAGIFNSNPAVPEPGMFPLYALGLILLWKRKRGKAPATLNPS